jgi:3-oxoacyl-[acyl-carrier protein] reductase
VAPGVIETDMLKDLSAADLDVLKREIPLQKIAKPDVVASLIRYLFFDKTDSNMPVIIIYLNRFHPTRMEP